MVTLKDQICTDFGVASRREWLETNGIGGYASSTVSGANTRRYHGLLVASLEPPVGRMVLLSKLEETLTIDGDGYEISSNRYPGTVHPEGFKHLKEFRLDPFPVWTYEVAGRVLRRTIFMPHGENSVVCTWELVEGDARGVSLTVKPLIAFRDFHHLGPANGEFNDSFTDSGSCVTVRPNPDLPPLHFSARNAAVSDTGDWYRSFEYALEQERGFDFTEDLYQPFGLKFDLGERAELIVSADGRKSGDAAELADAERERRAGLVKLSGAQDEVTAQLVLAADQFIVRRGTGHSVIAGYPWFSDWGRDTMISLPGLALSANRPEIARGILLEFSGHVSEGMLPNRFPDQGEEPEYNTVDASLWYFEAVRAYLEKTDDIKTASELYPALSEIIDLHAKGTRYGIRLDADGLLRSGEPGVQLTWMDAKVGDWVVTPREGKAVEIQALWYNALRTMEELAARLDRDQDSRVFAELAEKAKQSFRKSFWNPERDCLFDVVSEDGADDSVRPNQIFAVSLHHTMLSREKAKKVVRVVEEELLTPYGLRSLSPSDPAYVPRYEGGPYERDSAYHQGTVWAWLLGPFIDAFRRVNPKSARTEAKIGEFLSGIDAHLSDTGLSQISEIFDAEPPHEPRGCFAQAWSVAEVLRVMRN